MRKALVLLLTAACAASAAAAGKGSARKGARRAAARKPAPSAPAKTSPAVPAAAPAEALDEIPLFGFGVALARSEDRLVVARVFPGTPADGTGLKPGDALLRLAAPVSSRADAAAQIRAWTPGTRLPVYARRGLDLTELETDYVDAGRPYERGVRDSSAHEQALSAERTNQALADGRAVVKAVAPLSVPVRADQGLWVRFPNGLAAGLKAGDEVRAETATGLTVDATLDFLAVPPYSGLRARVLDAADDGETRRVRLAFYALDLRGGGTYPTLGAAGAVSGDQSRTRVAPGGAVVAAAPLPDAKRKTAAPVLDDAARLRVRLLEPLVVEEAPDYWRAGPGLWVKTVEERGRRQYEITLLIPGRSAEAAGLKVGERLTSIDGRSADKLDFTEAVDRLYGKPGTSVEVTVAREKPVSLSLGRGLRWASGKSAPLPLPYDSQR